VKKLFSLDPKRKVRIRIDDEGEVSFRLGEILVPPGKKVSLAHDFSPQFTGGFDDKSGALERVIANRERLSDFQEKLYAQDTYSLLVIFQAIDAAGKDGAIQHVMSGVNPQGCHVTSFKAPSQEELDHDYLWRTAKALPARGMIGIFNRSYYEEVLVVRVHPEWIASQKLPDKKINKNFWEKRFKEINNFEKYLVRQGTVILKFFLNVSKEEQKKRFIARIDEEDKNWKFSVKDYEERAHWDAYQEAIDDMLSNTSTEWAPWLVIPADDKWFARLAISETICEAMDRLDLKFPKLTSQQKRELAKIKSSLERE
jgi:PPK2 family polyphosphate:nucleotide phosphotransferase